MAQANHFHCCLVDKTGMDLRYGRTSALCRYFFPSSHHFAGVKVQHGDISVIRGATKTRYCKPLRDHKSDRTRGHGNVLVTQNESDRFRCLFRMLWRYRF